jgi:HSP20 family protein
MASITRSEGRELQQRAAGRPAWDPFRMLSDLVSLDPLLGALSLGAPSQAFVPAFDVRETKDAYLFEADLPGIQESDLEISVTGNRLSVSGKRETEQRDENERYFCSERTYGTFVRAFTLPDDADVEQVNAEFRDGVLRIKIPKRAEAQARRIALTGARSGGNGGQKPPAAGGQQQAGVSKPASGGQTPPKT